MNKSFSVVLIFLSAILPARPEWSPQHSLKASRQADFTQSQKMLDLLDSAARGSVPPEKVDAVLEAYGTGLIIRQQNISRSVAKEQYRLLLQSLAENEAPALSPVDSGERAKRGVEGLYKDVWPELKWAITHRALLTRRLEALKREDLLGRSTALAMRYLPERVKVEPRLHVVMGGRAGAAALDGEEIYFDILATSYRATTGVLNQYPTEREQVEYFAHEIHHLGLSQIITRRSSSLRLTGAERKAFDFVSALVMEGSASYLINGRRDLNRMRRDAQFSDQLRKADELLKIGEQILRSALEGELDGEEYQKAIAPMLGTGFHSAGAVMLSLIDQADGLKEVMEVLRDPRRLLVSYNKAVLKSSPGHRSTHQLDQGLAGRLSSIGQ